ncbi:hypothetical protein Barb7_03262 [Bacteroidales bacterium Barb7]|nr:hypothetical protein Barb7_03262 [Bacteroidales bacterium Barb7]
MRENICITSYAEKTSKMPRFLAGLTRRFCTFTPLDKNGHCHRSILKGYRISAPHGAQRNVGLRDGSGKRVLKERHRVGVVLVTPHFATSHSAPLHVGLKSLAPLGHLRNISIK